MKKKLSILLALVLAVSLLMVPVAVSAEVGIVPTSAKFVVGANGGVAEWSASDSHSGRYSVYLSDGGYGIDWEEWVWGAGWVEFTMDMLFADINPATLSYWFKSLPPLTPEHEYAFPYMWFTLDTTGGYTQDAVCVLHSGPNADWLPPQGVWTQWNIATYDQWHCGAPSGTLAFHQAAMPDARVLAVSIECGATVDAEFDPHIQIHGYVDDIEINGVVYDLEPLPIGGTVYPPNKLALLAPWIALGLVMIASAVIFLRRRRAWS